MTFGPNEQPPRPGTARAGRIAAPRSLDARPSGRGAIAFLALALAAGNGTARAVPAEVPEPMIAEVRIEGNSSIPVEQIRSKIKSKAGRPRDPKVVEGDLRTLLGTKWFAEVDPRYDKAPDGQGVVLIFQVREMPVLTAVEYRGRSKIKLKDLEENTGLKKGARADSLRARLAVSQIKRLYEEKGYELAEVELLEGGKEGDRKVVFRIFEGPKFLLRSIDFRGNVAIPDDTLRTKISSKSRLLGVVGGNYHRETLEEDRQKLLVYYQELGYFAAEVAYETKPGADLGSLRLTFTITEGVQFKVRNLIFEGNKKIPTAKLREGLTLHSGKAFAETLRQVDKKTIIGKYYEIGCIDTEIAPEPKFTDAPGVVDLVYHIEEGEPYLVGDLIFRGNTSTREHVLRREFVMAGVLPGEVLNPNRIEAAKTRLAGTQFFVSSPDMGKPIDVKVVNRRPYDKPYGEIPLGRDSAVAQARMQSPAPVDTPAPLELPAPDAPLDPGPPPPLDDGPAMELPGDIAEPAPLDPPPAAAAPPAAAPSAAPDLGPDGGVPFGAGPIFAPPPNAVPEIPISAPMPMPLPDGAPPRERSNSDPLDSTERPGLLPSLPNSNQTDVGPDLNEPFKPRAYADIVTQVDEAPTGRALVGIGASTSGGLSGTFVLHERNFDIWNIPRSFRELTSGNAFKGGGQEFRLELSPGTQINRASVSFREPYLFQMPISLSTQGYIFQRVYPDFTEARGGGRFALGRQFGTQTIADVAFRIEDVNVNGFKTPAPAELLAVSGHTTLFSIRPSLKYDNRNNPYLPSKGQYGEIAFEQGFGTFTFPKITVEGRQHFTVTSRPDNTGPHILTFRGFFGVTGRDTPIYERFFAGDFRSMRGFAYRGVGPRANGVNVGGILSAIGSVEYQFPWTANDQFQQVIFADFGTVENDYTFSTFRAAVGTGLRVNVPALGPLPLAFDLAFPVSKMEGDKSRYFTFFIGAFW